MAGFDLRQAHPGDVALVMQDIKNPQQIEVDVHHGFMTSLRDGASCTIRWRYSAALF
jgi:hypothetical protein